MNTQEVTDVGESGRIEAPVSAFEELFTEEAQAAADAEFGPTGLDLEPGKQPDNPEKKDKKDDAADTDVEPDADPDKPDDADTDKDDGKKDDDPDPDKDPDADIDPETVTFKVDGEDLTRAEIRELKKSGMRLEDYRSKTEEVAELRKEAQSFHDLMQLVKSDSGMMQDLEEWFNELPETKTKKLAGVIESIKKGKSHNAFQDEMDTLKSENDSLKERIQQFEMQGQVQAGLKEWAKENKLSMDTAQAVYDYAKQEAEKGSQLSMKQALVLYRADNPAKSDKGKGDAETEGSPGKRERDPAPPRGGRGANKLNTPVELDGTMRVPEKAFQELWNMQGGGD